MDGESRKRNGTYCPEVVLGTFDSAIAMLQATVDQVQGDRLSIALNRATPSFLGGGLSADDNTSLQQLAATCVIQHSPAMPGNRRKMKA